MTSWLAGAAAAVLVVAGVGVTLSRLDSSASGGGEMADATASPSASGERAELDTATATEEADEASGDMAATAEMATAMADSEADAPAADEEAETSASTFAATETTTSAVAVDDGPDLEPVADLTGADDLFARAEELLSSGDLGDDPATALGQEMERRRLRCPSEFEGFDAPRAVPIVFDGQPALFVFTSSPVERYLVITRECAVLASDRRP